MEGIEAAKNVKKFVEKASKCSECGRKYGDLTIGRVPPKTKEEFTKWCKEELCGDYGMGLRELWNFYKGLLPSGNELAEEGNAKAEEALSQITELRAMVAEPQKEKKVIKTVDGKEKVI